MKKRYIGIICIVLIVIVGLAMALSGGDKTTSNNNGDDVDSSTNTATNESDTVDDESDTSYNGYQIRIIYDGSWSGAGGSAGSIQSYDGTGEKTIDVEDVNMGIVSANAQKKDGSKNKLTIQILKDGEVIKEGSTTAAYGVAQITSS